MRPHPLVLMAGLLGFLFPSTFWHPAAADFVRLSQQRMEAVLAAAHVYGEDRALMLYCLRADPSDVAAAYAGLKSDLAEAVDRLRAAGGDHEQATQMVHAALARIRAPVPDLSDPALDARCAGHDFERELAEQSGTALPLVERPPFGGPEM